MAAQVTKLPLIKAPIAPSPLTADQKYWASFSSQQHIPAVNSSPITHISTNLPATSPKSFSASLVNSQNSFIVATTGPRLQLLSPQTLKSVRIIARASSPFHGASIRRDGRIVLAGSDSGSIQAFDTTSRAILKTWNEHKQPVWVTQWHPSHLTCAMSASDDTTVRLWDLPSDTSTWTGFGHGDYVRSGSFIDQGNLVVTGSYDQSIRIWDTRIGGGSSQAAKSCVMHFALSNPVEAVLPLPGGMQIVGAAGPSIAVLDIIAAKPLNLVQNHQKTVTCLASASNGTRVLSGALDGHVKVFNTADWTVAAAYKYASPILSLAMVGSGPSREDRHVCVGLQSGLLSIRTRMTAKAKAAAHDKEAELQALISGQITEYDKKKRSKAKKRGAGWEKRIRGKDYLGEGADLIINDIGRSRASCSRQSNWDASLRKGLYAKALNQGLETKDKTVIITVLTALVHRSALRTALANRNTMTLTPMLNFLLKHVAGSRYIRLITDVAMMILDMYAQHLGQSDDFDRLISRLHENVRLAAETAQMSISTIGMLDMLQAGTDEY